MQLQKLNNCFNEVNSELLLCVSCSSLRNSFSAFNKEKLFEMTEIYQCEFSTIELIALKYQIGNYIVDVHSDKGFANLNRI